MATSAHDRVDHGADRERAEDAEGHVALRVLRLLGRGRDGVEADVGEEHDRGALVDAAPAVGREGRPVGRVDVEDARRRRRARARASFRTTIALLTQALSLMPITSTQVMSATISDAGQVDRDGVAEDARQLAEALGVREQHVAVAVREPEGEVDAEEAQERA